MGAHLLQYRHAAFTFFRFESFAAVVAGLDLDGPASVMVMVERAVGLVCPVGPRETGGRRGPSFSGPPQTRAHPSVFPERPHRQLNPNMTLDATPAQASSCSSSSSPAVVPPLRRSTIVRSHPCPLSLSVSSKLTFLPSPLPRAFPPKASLPILGMVPYLQAQLDPRCRPQV